MLLLRREDGMATSKELRGLAHTLRGWASSVDDTKFRERIANLVTELEHLAQCEEVAERQFV